MPASTRRSGAATRRPGRPTERAPADRRGPLPAGGSGRCRPWPSVCEWCLAGVASWPTSRRMCLLVRGSRGRDTPSTRSGNPLPTGARTPPPPDHPHPRPRGSLGHTEAGAAVSTLPARAPRASRRAGGVHRPAATRHLRGLRPAPRHHAEPRRPRRRRRRVRRGVLRAAAVRTVPVERADRPLPHPHPDVPQRPPPAPRYADARHPARRARLRDLLHRQVAPGIEPGACRRLGPGPAAAVPRPAPAPPPRLRGGYHDRVARGGHPRAHASPALRWSRVRRDGARVDFRGYPRRTG